MRLKPKAFSLVEVMIGAIILLVVICALVLAFIGSMLLSQTSSNLVAAANDAQYVLEEIKGLDYGSIGSYSPPVFNNLPSESITLSRDIGTTIAKITVNVNWQERQRNRNFSISTYIAK